MNIVVLNASRNRHGNSARLAKAFLRERNYQQINLVDYSINQTGQHYPNDQLDDVVRPISHANTLVVTIPTYWSNMSG